MTTQKSDLLRGTLDLLILKIVALGPIHGYGISLRIHQISEDVLQVQQGSLYPALHRLEKKKWLKAKWGESMRIIDGVLIPYLTAIPRGLDPIDMVCTTEFVFVSITDTLLLEKLPT